MTAYARAVLAGAILTGPHVRDAAARHLRDLEHAPARGWRFDLAAAQRALDFFPQVLRLSGGEHEGKVFALAPSQEFIVGSIFGWLDATDRRRFRVAYVEEGKGNGKSPIAAGIGLYMLGADGEARAECYAAASKKDQAMILFRDAVAMCDLSPGLRDRVHQTGGRQVWNLSLNGSFFRPISSDDSQSGPRPHCALVDEVHEHRDDNVIEMLRAGFKGRRQPLLFMITNSGFDRTSVCWRYHDKACKVAAGSIEDDRFFSYVCAMDQGDDPMHDESCWVKTNPNLGVSIQPEYLRDQVREAQQMPSKEARVRRLHFCEWTDAASPWISGEAWRACEREPDASIEQMFSRFPTVVLAVDLSATTDLTALAIAAQDPDGGQLFGACEFWTPGDTIKARAERDSVPYDLWETQGHLRAEPGSSLDYGPLAERIAELGMRLNIMALVFDRYRMAYLKRELELRGVNLPLVEHPQGFVKVKSTGLWMPQSITEIEGAILGATITVYRNPVLTWCAASAVLSTDDQSNRVFSKRRSTGKIDGLVALTMCVGYLRAPTTFDVGAWVA